MKARTVLFTFSVAFLSAAAFSQPTIDGSLNDSDYILWATKGNTNSGFGTAIDISKLYYAVDVVNSVLFLGVAGKLDVGSDNGIGVWLDVKGTGSPTGASAGSNLGFSGAGHYIDGNAGSNISFKADFEVDYMFAFNPGGGSSSVFFDAAKRIGGTFARFQGSCNQTGTSATNNNANGTVFSLNSITFAFNNGGGATQGLEMRIPLSEIGATTSMQIEIFAFVVSSTGFFCDVTVPGNRTGGNPGFDADFGSYSGGPYHTTTMGALPVQLATFTGSYVGASSVRLNWRTVSELNNYGFYIERRRATVTEWSEVPGSFIPGRGTTSLPQEYSFTDNTASGGSLSYRLRQVDLDGSVNYSEPIVVDSPTSVKEDAPMQFALLQNYPNPFNPTTEIRFSVATTDRATLTIYNPLGQRVATLFDGIAESGRYHTVRFAAENLSSGTYFYRLQSRDRAEMKKLVIMK